jgi:hypothetical protein
MRKRQRAARAGQDEMWLTLPTMSVEQEAAATPPRRSDEPTYEDPWYQVLRRRLNERVGSDRSSD